MNQFAPRWPSLLHILSLVESIFRKFKCPIWHHNANYTAPLKNSLLHRRTGLTAAYCHQVEKQQYELLACCRWPSLTKLSRLVYLVILSIFAKKKSDSSYSQLASPMHCCTGQSFLKSGPKWQNFIKTMNIRFN